MMFALVVLLQSRGGHNLSAKQILQPPATILSVQALLVPVQ